MDLSKAWVAKQFKSRFNRPTQWRFIEFEDF
jgi:hypothetical protein